MTRFTSTCGNCRYFAPWDEAVNGSCRRHPPLVRFLEEPHVLTGDWNISWWPKVTSTEWCGEFQLRAAATDKYPAELPQPARSKWLKPAPGPE